eukprot:gene5091-5911_t
MKTPTQTNAIDFDSAKLQRLGFGQPSLLTRRPATVEQLRQQLGMQLQTSLEPEHILALFFREIQRLVPLDALQYRHEASDLRLEYGHRGHHSVSYALSHEGEHLGELVFRRNQRFLEDELANLESLLATLLYPMRNALLYRAATRSALRDPLTETGNRIAMDQTLQREIDMRLRQAAQAQDYWADDERIELTVSLGCSTLLAGESAESLLRRADSALYVAKREGRNRLAMAG